MPTASNSNKAIVFSAVTLLLTTLAHILTNACVWDLESHVGKQSSRNLNPAPSVKKNKTKQKTASPKLSTCTVNECKTGPRVNVGVIFTMTYIQMFTDRYEQ